MNIVFKSKSYCRDIEEGLGKEWEARGQLGSAHRPHFGHSFFRSSHPQFAGTPQQTPISPVAPVAAVAPVAPVAPVAHEGVQMSNMGGPAPISSDKPVSSGWV